MKSRLTHNLDKSEAEVVEREFKGAYSFRRQLREILNKDVENLYKQLRNDNLDDPNWQIKHTAILGEIKATIKLIGFLE